MGDSLDKAMSQIDKDFGSGSIMRLSDNRTMDVETFSTGSISLDDALGGGIPRGRIIEIMGPESSGKTTLALNTLASAQRKGMLGAFIDMEHALDPVYAKAVGINPEELLISQPLHAQQALETVRQLTRTGEVPVIVIDSVASLVPKQELEGEVGDAHVGLLPRLMSQALRMLNGEAKRTDTTLIFINQIREKVGVMFGSPEVTPGGRALKFYSSVRLDVRRRETVKDHGEAVANVTQVKVVKNKVAAPYKQAEFEIEFGRGISLEGELLDWGSQLGVIEKKGAWYYYPDKDTSTMAENGWNAAKAFLRENEDVRDDIHRAVWAATHDGEVLV